MAICDLLNTQRTTSVAVRLPVGAMVVRPLVLSRGGLDSAVGRGWCHAMQEWCHPGARMREWCHLIGEWCHPVLGCASGAT